MARGRLVFLPKISVKAEKYIETICLRAVRECWDNRSERERSFWKRKNSEK